VEFFWVPGGVLAVLAIQNAGLASGIGVLCSVIVLISMAWGTLIFHEPLWSIPITMAAVLVLIVGIFGMTFSLKPKAKNKSKTYSSINQTSEDTERILEELRDPLPPEKVNCCGIHIEKFWFGIACAVCSGVCGASCLVPSKLATEISGFKGGIEYLISFGVGAVSVNAVLWVGYVIIRLILGKPAFPKLHFRLLIVPGIISGILWSAGNFCALNAILHLGVGIGNSASQAQIIVSGLWGVLYYKEITGMRVLVWLFFVLISLSGIFGMGLMQYYGELERNSTAF